MPKKLYIYAPYVVSLLVAAIFSSIRDSTFFASDAAVQFVDLVGRWIPMVDNLHVATNYSTFIAFAHSVFWFCIPFMVWCGWQVIKRSTPQAKAVFFTRSSRFKRGLTYVFIPLMAFCAFVFALPTEHRGTNEPYVYSGFIGMSVDLFLQAFVFFMLGITARYALVEHRYFLDSTQGEQNG
jgi:hypothetical protein